MSKRPIAHDMLDLALAAREAYAAKVFANDAVLGKIKAAALAGHTHVRIKQEQAFNLELTEAALRLTERLCALGFKCHWFPIAVAEKIKGQTTGRQLGYRELTVDWAGADGRVGASSLLEKDLEGIIEQPER